MNEARHFALIVLLTAAVGLVAVLSNRLTERLKVPVPLLVLVAAAIAVRTIPDPPRRQHPHIRADLHIAGVRRTPDSDARESVRTLSKGTT